MKLLIQHRADVNQQSGSTKVPALSLACAIAAPASVVASLLEHGARVNPAGSPFACVHPLAILPWRASTNPHALEVAAMLLEARADVNIQYHSSGAWRAVELICRAGVRASGHRAPRMVQLFAEWSTTPLGFACFFGASDLVQMLLEAQADPELCNERGRLPVQLASSRSVWQVLQHHQATFSV